MNYFPPRKIPEHQNLSAIARYWHGRRVGSATNCSTRGQDKAATLGQEGYGHQARPQNVLHNLFAGTGSARLRRWRELDPISGKLVDNRLGVRIARLGHSGHPTSEGRQLLPHARVLLDDVGLPGPRSNKHAIVTNAGNSQSSYKDHQTDQSNKQR